MSTVIDQSRDLNQQELHRILTRVEMPDFLKEARVEEACGDSETAAHLFADTTNRAFPCHTKAATWMSAAYFFEKKADYPPDRAALLESRIRESAEYFGISKEVQELDERMTASLSKTAAELCDEDYAVVFTDEHGDKERHYPLRNANEVKAAAAWLVDNRDQLPFEDRRQIADRVLEKAASFGADVKQHRYELEKFAGIGLCSSKDAAALVRSRINALGHTNRPNKFQVELEKLAQIIEKDPQRFKCFAPLTKLASIIDQFDRKHGLHRHYDEHFERPEDVLFAITEKVAAELSDELVGSPLTGNFYKVADLERLQVDDLAGALGQDFADAVSAGGTWIDAEKLAKIVPTLPRSDAEDFDSVAASNGIRPFAVKAASAGFAIDPAEQEALAAMHRPNTQGLWGQIGG